jgi:hypothetical protein
MRNAILFLFFLVVVSVAAYGQVKKSTVRKYQLVEISTGLWIPTGRARLLGDHFMASFKVGGSINKFGYFWASDARFGKSSQIYLIRYNDSTLVSTSDFHASFYTGLAGYINLYSSASNEWFSIAGIGIDGFTSFNREPPIYPASKFVRSINFNVGFGLRTYPWWNKNRYVAYELNFNFVDYKNPGGTPLNGNVITCRVTLGFRSVSVKQTEKDLLWR